MDIECPTTGTKQKIQEPEFKPHVCLIYPTLTPLFHVAFRTEGAHSAVNSPSTTGGRRASGQGLSRGRRGGRRRPEVPRGRLRDRAAGSPGRAGGTGPQLLSRASQRQAPSAPGAAQAPARHRRAPSGAGAGTLPAPHASNTGHCPPRPATRSHPRRRRRGRARPHLPARLGERRPRPLGHGASPAARSQHSGPAGAAGTRGTRSEGKEGRGARSFPRPAGLSGRSGRPGGGREGGREGVEGRKEEGRGGGGAGRYEQSPRPAGAWKLSAPWRGREGVRAAQRGSAGPAPAARGLLAAVQRLFIGLFHL